MRNIIGSIDLKATRVPIVIPFAVTSVFAIAQLFLGCDPLILALSVTAILITFLPLHFNGRDLYSICAMVVGLRWVGLALVFKTMYGQPLQTNLFEPLATYAWMAVVMSIYTAIILLVRRFDSGKGMFSFPTDPSSLRRLALLSFFIGMVGLSLTAVTSGDQGGGGFAGYLIGILKEFLILACIAEAMRNLALSDGRKLFGPFLIAITVLIFLAASALNIRGFFLNCLIGVAVVAFIYKAIRLKYLVVGLVFAIFFTSFVTPVILYVRSERALPLLQFVEFGAKTAWKAGTDPAFLRYVKGVSEDAKAADPNNDNYDYFGARQNVANRLSFVALFDRVYMANKNLVPLGMEEVSEAAQRAAPRFFGFGKSPESVGDWLAWHTGLSDEGIQSYLNYGLPMEGYSTWGWIGIVTYPFLFIFPWLFVYTKIASFKVPLPESVFTFCLVQLDLIEQTSDAYMASFTKAAPILFCVLFGFHFLFFRGRERLVVAGATAEA